MSGYPSDTNKSSALLSTIAATAVAAGFAGPANAQIEGILEEIVVTATKREESLQDVPISVATMQGDKLNVLFTGSEDVLALSGRVPGLYAESSNGRAAPRFYMRGLGNIDFDLAASQPVSFVMDDVVLESAVLKGFPLFDIENIEFIRGPQGTLFGRNTTAGIVKINSRRPSDELSGYIKGSYATYGTTNIEGAVGGGLSDTMSARLSVLHRSRDNWITNAHTGQKSLGRYDESAIRAQFRWDITDRLSALLIHQNRSLDGTSSIFRANVFTPGSNALNQNYRRDTVYFDGGDDNPQFYDSHGTTLNIQWEADNATLTSITSFQAGKGSSRGDIDGGVVNIGSAPPPPAGITFADVNVFGIPSRTWPGPIFTPSVTEDGADVKQFTQELRLASTTDGRFSWQIGAFYFADDLKVTTDSFASFGFNPADVQHTIRQHKNDAWAVFGQGSWDLTERMNFTVGVRYTDDRKDFKVLQFPQLWLDLGIPTSLAPDIDVSDGQTSWDVSVNYAATDNSSFYGRFSNGFRAQTIQGRDVAFLEFPSVAKPETINSFEAGWKADLFGSRARINLALFRYIVDDLQLSIIGGASNANIVINSKEGEATGFELDTDFLISDYLLVSFGYAYNDTKLNDPGLAVVPCGSGLCTPLDPVDPTDSSRVIIDGNPFPRVPESTFNVSARVNAPVGNNAEIFAFVDHVYYGKINMPLYEAAEFVTDGQHETGVRIGYKNFDKGLEIAVFGRNVFDQDNVLGFIDFSNNTGFVNEPLTYGVEAIWEFGD